MGSTGVKSSPSKKDTKVKVMRGMCNTITKVNASVTSPADATENAEQNQRSSSLSMQAKEIQKPKSKCSTMKT
jgi:hypothetical protein